MQHLKNSNINISGASQKRQLMNYGYFHGYKGYRFFKTKMNQIPFTDFKEVITINKYDNDLKSLFYPKLMFIETTLKNITLDIVMQEANSRDVNIILQKLVPDFKTAPANITINNKHKLQKQKMRLQNKINHSLLDSYQHGSELINYFYTNVRYLDIPLWAIFEILTLGDFGFFVSCLNQTTRRKISIALDLNLASDTNITMIYNIIYNKGLKKCCCA